MFSIIVIHIPMKQVTLCLTYKNHSVQKSQIYFSINSNVLSISTLSYSNLRRLSKCITITIKTGLLNRYSYLNDVYLIYINQFLLILSVIKETVPFRRNIERILELLKSICTHCVQQPQASF